MITKTELKTQKKWGRKPKSNIIVNDNPVFDSCSTDNLIIKLDNKEADFSDDSNIEFSDSYKSESLILFNKKSICLNCNHYIYNIIIGLPIKYIDNTFYTHGDFCSFECASRYCFDNYNSNNDSYEIYSLLNLYYNIMENTVNLNTNLAPDKSLLLSNGGKLTIEQYREQNKELFLQNNPRTISISISDNNQKDIKYNINNFKLFRKKVIKKNMNNISNIMNLEIN